MSRALRGAAACVDCLAVPCDEMAELAAKEKPGDRIVYNTIKSMLAAQSWAKPLAAVCCPAHQPANCGRTAVPKYGRTHKSWRSQHGSQHGSQTVRVKPVKPVKPNFSTSFVTECTARMDEGQRRYKNWLAESNGVAAAGWQAGQWNPNL